MSVCVCVYEQELVLKIDNGHYAIKPNSTKPIQIKTC